MVLLRCFITSQRHLPPDDLAQEKHQTAQFLILFPHSTSFPIMEWILCIYRTLQPVRPSSRSIREAKPIEVLRIECFVLTVSLFFLVYWSMVDLQCYVIYYCTVKWFSYTHTYIHSFLDSFPIQVITEYWVEFPMLYSSSLLVICFIYSSVYMSVPISQFILPCSLTPW